MEGRVQEGDVVVVRYEGPKGGPGMREMYKAMKLLYGRGLALKTALITDGRFSETNNGCSSATFHPRPPKGGRWPLSKMATKSASMSHRAICTCTLVIRKLQND